MSNNTTLSQRLIVLDKLLPKYQQKGWDIDNFFDQRDALIEGYDCQDDSVHSSIVDGGTIDDAISLDQKDGSKLSGWRYLTNLGREYHQIMDDTGFGEKYSSRTARQHDIVCEVVIRIDHYLHIQAQNLLGGYVRLKGKNVTLRGSRIEEEDLVQDAAERVCSYFGRYDHDKSEFSTWISVVALRQMLSSAAKRKFIHSSSDFYRKDDYVDIWGPADGKEENPSPSQGTYESRYLPDIADVSGEEFVAKKELKRDLTVALGTLSLNQSDILHQRFFEERSLDSIGEPNYITGKGIRYRVERALRKLRHPARKLHEHLA